MEILLIILGLGALGLYNKAILASTIGVIFINIKNKKGFKKEFKKVNYVNFIVLILFSVAYGIIAYIHQDTSLSLIIVPWIAYYFGTIICSEDKKEKQISNYVIAIAIGLAVHAILNFIYALIVNSIGRNTLDIWSQQVASATLQGTMLVMIESLLYYIIMCEKDLKRKVILIVLFILGILYNIRIGTRTTLIICVMVFISAILLNIFLEKNKKAILKKIGIIMLVITVILLLLVICYLFNIFDIGDKINNSELIKRFINKQETNDSDNLRWLAFKSALEQVFDYPFGGNKMQIEKVKYAHNFWLDINRVAGIIPFVLIIVYTVLVLKNLIMTIRNKTFSNSYKILVFSIYLGSFISFAVEPIMEGATYYFVMFCIINGIVDKNLLLANVGEIKNENTLDS